MHTKRLQTPSPAVRNARVAKWVAVLLQAFEFESSMIAS